jgi:hypothetical protein
MNNSPNEVTDAGKANTVLLFGDGEKAIAVISAVVTQVHKHERGRPLRYFGPVTFAQKTAVHTEEVVLRAVNSILMPMNLPRPNLDVSVVNLSAASLHDIGSTINGFSGDCSVFESILSATLQMEIPPSIVSTGHIASPAGEIRMVKGLPAKLKAARNSESIETFIYPDPDGDTSMEVLSPTEWEHVEDALLQAKQELRLVPVRGVDELLRAVFSDEEVVMASLKNGYYHGCHSKSQRGTTAVIRAFEYLTSNNEDRFWIVLERQLLTGREVEARELVHALVSYYIDRNSYPKNIGSRLYWLLASLPPETRRFKVALPLLPVSECIQLSQFAKDTDYEDVSLLFKPASEMPSPPLRVGSKESEKSDSESRLLELILSEIDPDRLKTLVSLPIDSACAAYPVKSVTMDSYDNFLHSIAALYIHIMRHYRKISEPVDMQAAEKEALQLLEDAFSKEGGLDAAWAEAKHATTGGMRFIFDSMTRQLIEQEKERHINYVLKSTLDPLDKKAQKSLIVALLEHMKPFLPPDLLSQPAEKFLGRHDVIIRSYIQSVSRLKSLFRSL